jgi:uncharacterized protein
MARAAISTTDGVPAAGGRVPELDALRGFALAGILLMNIEFFTRPLQGMALGMDPQWQGVDRLAALGVATLVQGKFWTLFSLLFGVGFAVMLERADAARASFDALFLRRLTGLLVIGLLHATLVWSGDILVPYALAGFVLWLVHRAIPAAQLWRVGVAVYALPLLLMWLSVLAVQALPAVGEVEQHAAARVLREEYATAAQVYAHGGFAEATAQRVRDSLMQYSWLGSILPAILGVFLIGAGLQRSGVLRDPVTSRPFFTGMFALAFPAGLVLASWSARRLAAIDVTVLDAQMGLYVTASTLANLMLCASYGSAFLLAATRPGSRLTPLLAPAGRMALSNYLLQSLFFTTLFYGYGLGQWGAMPRAWQVLAALAFFALQVAGSHAWMARYRHGPVEWLWRAWTYLRLPAMRR